MNARRVRMILGLRTGLSLLVLGGVGGMAIERMRFEPERAAMLERLEAVIRAHQATVMAIGPGAQADAPDLERRLGAER